MKIRAALAASALVLSGATAPIVVTVDYAQAAPHTVSARGCTHTSSGSCIRGGQFCPQASYGHSGYSATGKRYVCKGDHSHPHWMLP